MNRIEWWDNLTEHQKLVRRAMWSFYFVMNGNVKPQPRWFWVGGSE